MNNLIYKEDAIKVINDEITIEGIVTHYEAMRDAVHQAKKIYNKRLEELPPAESKIIKCRDCKNYHEDECPMRHVEYILDGFDSLDEVIDDYATDDGFCYMGDRRENE